MRATSRYGNLIRRWKRDEMPFSYRLSYFFDLFPFLRSDLQRENFCSGKGRTTVKESSRVGLLPDLVRPQPLRDDIGSARFYNPCNREAPKAALKELWRYTWRKHIGVPYDFEAFGVFGICMFTQARKYVLDTLTEQLTI
jgi:hypothetical protein